MSLRFFRTSSEEGTEPGCVTLLYRSKVGPYDIASQAEPPRLFRVVLPVFHVTAFVRVRERP